MRKIIAITQLSLDGIMQGPGGPDEDRDNGFTTGGWAMTFFDDVLDGVVKDTIAGEFGMLLGRRTYDIFAGYWPLHGDDPIGIAFNKAAKYVVTHRAEGLSWEQSHQVNGVDGVRQLKATAGPDLHIWGSSNMLQALIAADLVDEYRFWLCPVLLGNGKRLFENGVPPRTLALVDAVRTATGVLVNTYRPDGKLRVGQA